MRKSPVPAGRSSLGKPEVNVEDPRSPDRPAKPPRLSGEPLKVSVEPSPQPSPRAPPRPPSIKSSAPPPRPPPPTIKGNEEIMINYPGDSNSLSRSRPASDRNINPDVAPPRPKPPSRKEPSRGSLKNDAPYNPELNPFGDDDDTNEPALEELDESKEDSSLNPFGDDFDDEEEEVVADKSIEQATPDTPPPPPPQRVSVNPFFTASVKKKAAPLPPQKTRSGSELPSPSSSKNTLDQGEGHSIYANVDSTEGGKVTLDNQSTTSGSANEKPAGVTDAPPITIVSVCL